MIYMKKGALIRLCDEHMAERLKREGFLPMEPKPGPPGRKVKAGKNENGAG